MILLDGKLVSEYRRQQLKPRVASFIKNFGRAPHLAVILVGDMVASQVYVRNKEKACEAIGIKSTRIDLPQKISQTDLEAQIEKLMQESDVDALLLQLPLPAHLSAEKALQKLRPEKDADGLTEASLGKLWANKTLVAPCTPKGVMNLLEYYKISIEGKHAVVVGRSDIVGKPMAHLLVQANATVTICHSKSKNISDYTKNADIVIVAAGKKHLLGKEDFNKNAVVVDVGMHGTGQGAGASLAGDVRFSEIQDWIYAATPVPGGVGPMTITTLLENTLTLAEKRHIKL